MIPGPLSDDQFRMVEDEFLHTAQRFTTHLHRAEYSRLKAVAKSENAAAIREIERPVVVGPQTSTAKRRQEAVKRAAKQRKVLRDGDDDAPWMGTSLQGLMESPRKAAKALSSYAAGPATTRAAAGFQASRSAQGRTTQDEPGNEARSLTDINGPQTHEPDILPPPSRSATVKTPVMQTTSSATSTPKTPSRSFPISTKPAHNPRSGQRGNVSEAGHHNDDDEDEDDPFGMNQRKIRREKSREQFRKPEDKPLPKKAAPDTVPSFL